MKYVAHEAHKDGGSVCAHKGCTDQATIAEAIPCDDNLSCKQALAELEARYRNVDWTTYVTHRAYDIDQRQLEVAIRRKEAADKGVAEHPIVAVLEQEIADMTAERETAIATARVDYRAVMMRGVDGHDHPQRRCVQHAADLGAHVKEAVDAMVSV